MAFVRNRRDGWGYSQPPNVPFEINKASPQSNGLVAWWTCLGQNAGQVALRDMMGRFDMTVVNTPVISSSAMGPVVLFDDGSSEYLTNGNAAVITYPITMACWVNTNDLSVNQSLIIIADTATSNNFHQLYIEQGLDMLRVRSDDATATIAFATTTTAMSINTWHHACGVFTSSTNRAVFLDGGGKGTDALDVTPVGLDSTTIAVRRTNFNQWYLSGMIAESRIYNRALSDAEVYALYAPQTRWELYKPLTRLWNGLTVTVVGGTVMPIIPLSGVHSVIGGGQIVR